ncbi:MAG: ATP-binding cassette domain-containing protein [Candidatus Omnitrophota bacterium]
MGNKYVEENLNGMDSIQANDLWLMYKIPFSNNGKISWDNFWALKGISFNVRSGEAMGIIGENGAGKTTLLRALLGLLKCDRGSIKTTGRVSALLEAGAGFEPELSGQDNIRRHARFFGLAEEAIEAAYPKIAEFAELGRFIQAPVKCYSQGMLVRLAFSIAVHMQPDILLIDDSLTVGDEYFQAKCVKKIFQLKEEGKTIILVSHNTSLLVRLCDRLLLLKDGRLLRQGSAESVVPLYIQLEGEKAGTALIRDGALELVFNNGRVFLNWQGRLLTPEPGVYTAIKFRDKWLSGLQASWEAVKPAENRIIARGIFYEAGLEQIWTIELATQQEVLVSVDIKSRQAVEVEESFVNMMLRADYREWFSLAEQGEFSPITSNSSNWRPYLGEGEARRCVGVREARDAQGQCLPTVIFEQENSSGKRTAQILNSDYLCPARVLQYKTFCRSNYAKTAATQVNLFQGKIVVGVPDIGQYLDNIEYNYILQSGDLKLKWRAGQVILSRQGKVLTKANHASTLLRAGNQQHFSTIAEWVSKKQSENKIVAAGTWPGVPLVEHWEMELKDGCFFIWKIWVEVTAEVSIQEAYARFSFCEQYKSYRTSYGAGKFPDEFMEYEVDMLQKCVPDGSVILSADTEQMPEVCIQFPRPPNIFAKVLNSDMSDRARIVYVENIIPEDKMRFAPGKYECFEIHTAIAPPEANGPVLAAAGNTAKLKKDGLEIVFEKGQGHIFWQGMQLTKRLGLYTSIRSGGRWFDSHSQAVWEVKNSDNTIEASGKWIHLPLVQTWRLAFAQENMLEFAVTLEAHGIIDADRLQTNIMVSELYDKWVGSQAQGVFPDFKGEADDDWDVVRSEPCGAGQIAGVEMAAAGQRQLPSITFYPDAAAQNWAMAIVNSDLHHRSRLLQHVNKGVMKFVPQQIVKCNFKILIGKRK